MTKMDPRIWSRLPEELLEHVLSLLPLKTVLNLRSTCKHINSLIFSPFFITKHSSSSSSSSSSSPSTSSSPPFSSFLLLSHPQLHNQFNLYDTGRGAWRNVALSLSLLLPYPPPTTLLSTSNGLCCFSLPNSYSFLVCNLLAKSTRLVKFPVFPFAFELLTLVTTQIGFKIFVLSSRCSANNAYVYDSVSRLWQQFDTFEPIRSENYHQEGVLFNGHLYFTTPEPFSVVSFDLESGKWERLRAELPVELTFVRLVSDGEEKLHLIGGIGRNGISRNMKLWELDEGKDEKWVEMERLPELMCRKFVSVCYHNYEHVYCFWHQGMICICCYTWPEILYYKVSRRTWHWLPKCPSLPAKWSCGFRWFSFVPELYALV